MTSSRQTDSPAEPQTKALRLTRRAIRQAAQAQGNLVEGAPPLVLSRHPERPPSDSATHQNDPATATTIPPRRPQLPRIARPEPPPAAHITAAAATLPRAEGPAWPVAPPGHDWIDERFRRTRPVGELAPTRSSDQDQVAPARLNESAEARPSVPPRNLTSTPLRPSLDHLSRPQVPLSRRALAQARRDGLVAETKSTSQGPQQAAPAVVPTQLIGPDRAEINVVPPDLTTASRAAAELEALGTTAIIPAIDAPIAPINGQANPAKPPPTSPVPAHQTAELPVDQTGPVGPLAVPIAPEPVASLDPSSLPAAEPDYRLHPWPPQVQAWLRKARTWLTRVVPVWGGVTGAVAAVVALVFILSLVGGQKAPQRTLPPADSVTSAAPRTTAPATPGPTPTAGQAGASKWSIGKSFTSGDFTLKLLSVQTGLPELGEAGQWTAANGAFVVLKVQITYTGTGQGSFPPDQQHLIVASGRAYDTDIRSASQLPASPLGVDLIPVNQPVIGYLAFDINDDDSPAALEFKGDFLSDTVQIPLG